MTVQAATDAVGVARAILGATRGWSRPVVAALVGGDRVAPGIRVLEEAGLPCYPFPEPAVTAIAGMALVTERARAAAPEPAESMPLAAASVLLDWLRAAGGRRLDLGDLTPLLTAYDIPVLVPRLAGTPEEAAAIAGELGCPVALKIASPDISHKNARRSGADAMKPGRAHARSEASARRPRPSRHTRSSPGRGPSAGGRPTRRSPAVCLATTLARTRPSGRPARSRSRRRSKTCGRGSCNSATAAGASTATTGSRTRSWDSSCEARRGTDLRRRSCRSTSA
jgi:ATP-grasp domain